MVGKSMEPLIRAAAKTSSQIQNPCAACAVRDLSICGALESADVAKLNAIVTQQFVRPGETLFFEEDPADSLYVLLDGCIKLYKMLPDGRRQITGFLYPSDVLGIAFRSRYAYTAEAVTGAMLCRFGKEKLEKMLDEHPAMERRLLGIASNELAAAQDQMLLLGRKTAEEKLATFLTLLSRRLAMKERDADMMDLPMNRADIADFLGLTIETVSRSFSSLKKQGIIRFDTPQKVHIVDTDALAEKAGLEDWSPTDD